MFHPNAPSNAGSISSAFKKHEDAKKELMVNVSEKLNRVFFTPLVFSSTGGLGREATTFYKRLADLLANKEINLTQSLRAG